MFRTIQFCGCAILLGVSLAFLLRPALARAGDGPWTDWITAMGDDAIQYRSRVTTYDRYITPTCDVEIRNQFGRASSVRATISIDGIPGHGDSVDKTFYPGTDQHGKVLLDYCQGVGELRVTRADRR